MYEIIFKSLCFQVDKHESSRAVKKAELIENLKRLFPGVVCVHNLSRRPIARLFDSLTDQ